MAKAKATAYSPIKSGYDPRKDARNNGDGPRYEWLRIQPNESFDVVLMVDVENILATEQCAIWLEGGGAEGKISPVWVYTGPEDPMHDLEGVTKSYRAFIPVLSDNEVKVWPMGKMVHTQILDISDAAGSTAGMVVRVKRVGSGLATRYSVTPTGKRVDVSKYDEVDVIPLLGPLTPQGVRELIAARLGVEDYDEVLEQYRGKDVAASSKKKVGRPKKAAPVVEEEDDDDEDLLLDDDDDEEDDD